MTSLQLIRSTKLIDSASQLSTRHNPFAGLSTPSKSQPAAFSQSFRFTPQLSSKSAASPFRNPAFTTPRRPLDEVIMSEASGNEDSPGLTETSDFVDTPQGDRVSDVGPIANNIPLKVDKSSRYAKHSSAFKKHASGKGEIKLHREHHGAFRKRKRHNLDRDISGPSSRQSYGWAESESDSDGSFTSQAHGKPRYGRKVAEQRGMLGSLFHMLDEHPNAPDNLSRWIQLIVNFFFISACVYFFWMITQTVRRDINNANESARLELLREMAECQNEYTVNQCAQNQAPRLVEMCNAWHDCMKQDPESTMRIKAVVKHVAEIINEFSETMNLKAWVSLNPFKFINQLSDETLTHTSDRPSLPLSYFASLPAISCRGGSQQPTLPASQCHPMLPAPYMT